MKQKLCPFCGNRNDFNRRISVGKNFFYLICGDCRGGILYPKPEQDKLEKIYKRKSYFENLAKPLKNKLVQKIFSLRLFPEPSEWVTKNFNQGVILDVGCGNGEFLADLKRSGWEVYGSDISHIAKKNTEKRIGNGRVKVGVFNRQKFKKNFFDVVSFWHVLEHTDSPYGYLSKANKFLKAGGIVIGEVPNFDSLWVRSFKQYYAWIMLPEHHLYFSKMALEQCLKRANFSEIKIFSTPRALLNFSISLNNYFRKKEVSFWGEFFFIFSIPISIILTFVLSKIDRGEVLRFIAKKV